MIGKKHQNFLKIAFEEAQNAFSDGEVPVGAVLVSPSGEIIAQGRNHSGLQHAEMVVIEEGLNKLNFRKLEGFSLYTSLEPCIMCAGAILNSHISKVFFSAWDEKFGASGSVWDLLRDPHAMHHPEVYGGINPEKSERLLKEFFEGKR